MTERKIVWRGWKEICQGVGLRSVKAARDELKRLGIHYEKRRPVVSIMMYENRVVLVNQGRRETKVTKK